MSDLDREEEAVLESVRRALTPSSAVTRRMRTALLAKLAAPAAAAAAAGATTSATGAATTASLVEGVADSAAVASGAGTVAGAGGAVASGAGTLAAGAKVAASAGALATGAKVAVSAALLKTAAGVATAAMLATAGGYYWSATVTVPDVATPAPTGASVSAPSKRAAPAHGSVASAPLQRERAGVEPPQPPTPAGSETTPAIAVPHVAANAASQQLLQGELDVLKRVRQALQVGDAQLALSLLAKLDAEHPVSPLWQEREVARVLALCGAGRVTAARQAAQRLLGPNPNSLYAERIQASCAATSSQEQVPANTPANDHPAESPKSTKVAPPVARFGDPGN